MANDLRASDPVEDLVVGAAADSEASEEAAVEAIASARADGAVTEEAHTETPSVTPEVKIGVAREDRSTPAKRITKAEAVAQLERTQQELDSLKQRTATLEARTNEKAINDLGATFALALNIGSRFMAAQRGEHWLFKDAESRDVGEAWAVVAAPYADKLKTAVPWALAIGVTWKTLEPRLTQDRILAEQQPKDVATAE